MLAGPIKHNKYRCLNCKYETFIIERDKKPYDFFQKIKRCPKCQHTMVLCELSPLGLILKIVDYFTNKGADKNE